MGPSKVRFVPAGKDFKEAVAYAASPRHLPVHYPNGHRAHPVQAKALRLDDSGIYTPCEDATPLNCH